MLLFGVTPFLFLIYSYVLIWQYGLDDTQKASLNNYFDYATFFIIALGAIGVWIGFKKSALQAETTLNDVGIKMKFTPALKLLPTTEKVYNWNEISGYSYLRDLNGYVIKIFIRHSNKPIVLGQSNIVSEEKSFLEFYESFKQHSEKYNLTQHGEIETSFAPASIQQQPNFYASAWARVLAIVFLLLCVFMLILVQKFGVTVSYFWLKLGVMFLMSLAFSWRAFVSRK